MVDYRTPLEQLHKSLQLRCFLILLSNNNNALASVASNICLLHSHKSTLNQLWMQVVKSSSREATQCPLTSSQSSVAIVANGDQARCHSSRPLLDRWFSLPLAAGHLLFVEVSSTEPASLRKATTAYV